MPPISESAFSDFGLEIRAAVRMLWKGYSELFDFVDGVFHSISRGLTRAWNEGLAAVGIKPDEMTQNEKDTLTRLINSQLVYIADFGKEIQANSQANKGKLTPLLGRTSVWTNRANEAKNLAMRMAGGNQKMEWVLHGLRATKVSCSTCLRLAGRVYRATTWDGMGIRPQSPRLACAGFNCGCAFRVTDKALTRGRPPSF